MRLMIKGLHIDEIIIFLDDEDQTEPEPTEPDQEEPEKEEPTREEPKEGAHRDRSEEDQTEAGRQGQGRRTLQSRLDCREDSGRDEVQPRHYLQDNQGVRPVTVYMQVSRDKYELPEIVTDTIQEMAEKSGSTVNCIRSHISHRKAGRLKKDRFIRVEVEEDDEQQGDMPYMSKDL